MRFIIKKKQTSNDNSLSTQSSAQYNWGEAYVFLSLVAEVTNVLVYYVKQIWFILLQASPSTHSDRNSSIQPHVNIYIYSSYQLR